MPKTILLLKENGAIPIQYIVDIMAREWMASGHRVIHHAGTRNMPDADILFLHVDKTLVPEEYEDYSSKYPAVINGKILDISRKRYSTAKLGQHDEYGGPVIVKTNNNYGGLPEHRSVFKSLSIASSRLLLRQTQLKVWRQMAHSWSRLSSLDPLEYPIFNNMGEVPSAVWKNNNLIVEKFIPEREGKLFFVRYWTFFGDKNLTGRYGCPHPIVKFHRCVTAIMPVDIPEELILWRKKLNMDYGRFDYVMYEGKPVLLDVNKTQAAGQLTDGYRKQFAALSAGIDCYLK